MTICDKKKMLGFDDSRLMLIGIPLVGLIMPFMFFGDYKSIPFTGWYFRSVVITCVHTTVFWLVLRKIFMHTRKKFPVFKDTGRRLFYQMLLAIIVYLVLEPLLNALCISCFLDMPSKLHNLDMTITSLTMIALVMAIYEGIYLYEQLKKSIQEKEQLQRENIQSQLEGLKSQVNPHFLFNSLNTLSYLIPEDADKSVKFVQKLSKVYRYILEMSEEELIPLRKELEFLNSYIFLLKERFEENLQVEVDIPKNRMDDQIIPLSLQILFENAIKHNIISSSKPLTVKVSIGDDNRLIVKNNLQKKKQIQSSTKFGLENIRNRYRFFSNEAVNVISTASSFMVSLPLITVK